MNSTHYRSEIDGLRAFAVNARSYICFCVEEKRSIKNTIDVDFVKLNAMTKTAIDKVYVKAINAQKRA
jgi:hypothetical protein